MASQRQREANRRNGRKGGPKTEAGKQRSRSNALQHGLTSTTLVVLPGEHQHEYEEVLHGFRESFQPHDAAEDALVLRLAHAHWRSLRSRSVETGILNITAATERSRARTIVENRPENLNTHNAIAVAFMTNPADRWQMYLRYDTTIARDFFRTLEALTRLQKARRRGKPPETPVLAAAAGTGFIEPSPLSDSGIRSVSQTGATLPTNNEQKQLTHEPNQHNSTGRLRTPRNARPVANTASVASHRVGRKERNLRRLSAAARVLSRNSRRAGARNSHTLGRKRKPRTSASVLKKNNLPWPVSGRSAFACGSRPDNNSDLL